MEIHREIWNNDILRPELPLSPFNGNLCRVGAQKGTGCTFKPARTYTKRCFIKKRDAWEKLRYERGVEILPCLSRSVRPLVSIFSHYRGLFGDYHLHKGAHVYTSVCLFVGTQKVLLPNQTTKPIGRMQYQSGKEPLYIFDVDPDQGADSLSQTVHLTFQTTFSLRDLNDWREIILSYTASTRYILTWYINHVMIHIKDVVKYHLNSTFYILAFNRIKLQNVFNLQSYEYKLFNIKVQILHKM